MVKKSRSTRKKPQPPAPALTGEEQRAVDALRADKRTRVRPPDLRLDYDEEERRLAVRHDSEHAGQSAALAMHEIGSSDPRFYAGILEQVAALGAYGHPVSETASNFVLSVVGGVKPQDEVESMLAVQMGAIHQATMMMARRLNHVETLAQQDSAERALNKLARTFASQVETLKKYRSKADQTVRVERVEVQEGGQAIVGNVSNGGRGNEET
ncbi:hypothetical protein [Falsiruegeria mediterranea]